jgi:hypothetical protein
LTTFLDSRAEICQIFLLAFWENLRHQKDILKLTDLSKVDARKNLKKRTKKKNIFNKHKEKIK